MPMEKEFAIGASARFRWPSTEDRLLRAEGDWDTAITFDEHHLPRHTHIWSGYMRAGAVMVDYCQITGGHLDRHELVYPILFCYRHGLEMAMKWIIGQYGAHVGLRPSQCRHHDLWKLWTACKKVMLEIGSDGETEGLIAVEAIVKEFNELDKGSFSFRYPTDRRGMTIRLPRIAFDLANIKNVMEAVDNLFLGADGQLDNNTGAADW